MKKKQMHTRLLESVLLVILGGSLVPGCFHYQAKPLDSAGNLEDLARRSLSDDGLRDFIEANTPGMVTQWPPKAWDFGRLTLAALYFSPDLETARATYAEAEAARITAGERLNPSIGVGPGYNASTPSGGVSPWILGINFDVPLELAGKRGLRLSEAQHLSDAAKLRIAGTAWEIRSNVRRTMVDLWAVEKQALLSEQKLAAAEALVKISAAQYKAGDIDRNELMGARLLEQQARLEHGDARGEAAKALIRLSVAAGLSPHALDEVEIDFSGFETLPPGIPSADARRNALLNRADILSSLAGYAASESALRLEIAKQYPDLNLSPGYEFDQGDNKWQLGFQLTLPLLSQNRGPIAQAEAKRKTAAAGFASLQASVLGEIETATVAFQTDLRQLMAADTMLQQAQQQADLVRKQYAAGAVSKQDELSSQLEKIAAASIRLASQAKTQTSLGELEYALQTPLDATTLPAASTLMEEK